MLPSRSRIPPALDLRDICDMEFYKCEREGLGVGSERGASLDARTLPASYTYLAGCIEEISTGKLEPTPAGSSLK